MKPKEGFEKKLTLEEMVKKTEEAKKQNKYQQKADELAHEIDMEIDKAVVDVLKELGFEDAEEGMSDSEAKRLHDLMKEAGQFINISYEQVNDKYIVTVSVIQTARTIEFDLGGE